MPKRDKEARKRVARRERAKTRETGDSEVMDLDSNEAAIAQSQPGQAQPTPPRERASAAEASDEEPVSFMEQMADFFAPITDFFKEVGIEARKINWPPTDETWRSTRAVIFIILFLAAFMGLFGWGFTHVSNVLFGKKIFVPPATPAATGTNQESAQLPVDIGGTPPAGGTSNPSGNTGGTGGGTTPPAGN